MECLQKRHEQRPRWVAELMASLELFAPKPELPSRGWLAHAKRAPELVAAPKTPAAAATPPAEPIAAPMTASNR